MAELDRSPDRSCARLQQQIALSTLMDDLIVAVLAARLAAYRDAGMPDLGDLEHMIRSHRVAVVKQDAILGAAGITV